MQILPLTITFFALLGLAWGFIPCADPSKHVGHWIGRNQECAALVQTSCHRPGGKAIGLTNHWVRGVHVKENCHKIPKLTAIASFLGPNHHYDAPGLHQHTAIFVRCETAGIRVYDQWNGTPIGFRIIPWTNSHLTQYRGNNFYTVA